MKEQLYKVLDKDRKSCNNDANNPVWKPNKWMPKLKGTEPCEEGMYHLCRLQDIVRWLSSGSHEVWEAEYRGKVCIVHDDSKVAVQEARITRKVLELDDTTLRLIACDIAELALEYAAEDARDTLECVIYVSRCYAYGEASESELGAAWSAAGYAARYAARYAAWYAAGYAAWSAADQAAGAARYAAGSAAESEMYGKIGDIVHGYMTEEGE